MGGEFMAKMLSSFSNANIRLLALRKFPPAHTNSRSAPARASITTIRFFFQLSVSSWVHLDIAVMVYVYCVASLFGHIYRAFSAGGRKLFHLNKYII